MLQVPQGISTHDVLGLMGHAWRVGPLVEPLAAALLFSSLGSDEHKHYLYRSRSGPNSWGLYLADGREFHFRGGSRTAHYDCIEVYKTYRRNGHKPVAVLATREDCRTWVAGLKFNPFVAKANGRAVRAA